MARRRMIDPRFWASVHHMRLCFRQRLLFIGLFSNSDDDGRLQGNVFFVRATVFPYDDISISVLEEDLRILEEEGMILWYTIEEEKGREAQYIQIVNWRKYQRIEKPRISDIPSPAGIYKTGNESGNDSRNGSSLNETKGNERNRNETKGIPASFSDKSLNETRPSSFQYASLCDEYPFIQEITKLGNDREKTIRVPRLMRLYNEHGIDKIKWGYAIVKDSIEQGLCKNPPAMFESAVKNSNYTMHPGSRAAEIYNKL